MKNNNIMVGFKSVAVALAAFSLAAASALAAPVKNIVLPIWRSGTTRAPTVTRPKSRARAILSTNHIRRKSRP